MCVMDWDHPIELILPLCMQAQYLMLLCSFREQLQQHVRVHAVEAVMACREIEQSLQDLTGKIMLFFFLSPSFFRKRLHN